MVSFNCSSGGFDVGTGYAVTFEPMLAFVSLRRFGGDAGGRRNLIDNTSHENTYLNRIPRRISPASHRGGGFEGGAEGVPFPLPISGDFGAFPKCLAVFPV